MELLWLRAAGEVKGWSRAPPLRSRGNCISFWSCIPPLQGVPSLACSVASLSNTQVIGHQELATYMVSSLWAICLVGVSHPHDAQHVKERDSRHHPASHGHGGLDARRIC